MERKNQPMRFSNWPILSPQRPRSPSSDLSSSSASSFSWLRSFSSDITEFTELYDAAEDWSENMEQATYYREEIMCDYRHPILCTEGEILESPNLKAFTFEELKQVTNDFHFHRVIGEGGFGRVYKGWIREQSSIPSMPGSGMAVAVKILNPEGFEGRREWQTEVLYLGQIRHPNVVKFIGFCSEDDHLALVYEYVERGSLDNHLFKGDHPLSWTLRVKVAIGIAKALSFLHDAEIPTIFRGVKPSHVLLDAEFNAKLSDFGLAVAGPAVDETCIETEAIMGYINVKSDVYGFGVVLLELLSGRRAFDRSWTRHRAQRSLVEWAKPYLGYKRKLIQFMDPNLKGQYPKEGANEVAKLALQCLKSDPKLRPRMSDVLTDLERLRLQHWNDPIWPSGWLSSQS